MKRLILALIWHSFPTICQLSFGQNLEPSYYLSIPKGWQTERFSFPLNFAPEISYQGVEDLRFAPGWAKSASEEYWSYAILWYLEGSPEINSGILEKNLNAYFSGLIRSNLQRSKALDKTNQEVLASIEPGKTEPGDSLTFTGSINMLDYLQKKKIRLRCLVHVKPCQEGKTAIFFEFSPQASNHPIWSELHQLWQEFRCKL
jgi:hypothetical protein